MRLWCRVKGKHCDACFRLGFIILAGLRYIVVVQIDKGSRVEVGSRFRTIGIED